MKLADIDRVNHLVTELDDVKSLIASNTRVIDLERKMVMPGINDVHTHPLLGGRADLYECRFLPTLSLDEVLAVVRADARKAKPGAWIVGGSWGSNFTSKLSTLDALRALNDASVGHPVLPDHDRLSTPAAHCAKPVMAVRHPNPGEQEREQHRCL